MKILNNFDTELKKKEYNEAVKKYGKDGVILIQKYISYWIIKGIFPFIAFSILIFPFRILSFYLLNTIYILGIILFIINIIISLIIFYYLIHKYIEYSMDFTIVTKDFINSHKQISIIDSQYKNLPAGKIRSIQSSRQGLLGNIFEYGYIEFLTDGAQSEMTKSGRHQGGKLRLKHVHHPNSIRKKISSLCIGKEQNIVKFNINEQRENENDF